MSNKKGLTEQALEQENGILRLAPIWMPRFFCRLGKRIELYPNDDFALRPRGRIDERWFSSTTLARNGPDTLGDECFGYIHES